MARHFLNSAACRAFHTLKAIVERRGALRAILRRLKYPALAAALRSWLGLGLGLGLGLEALTLTLTRIEQNEA